MKPTNETFIVQLTVEQLVDILKQEFPLLTLTKADLQPPKKEEKEESGAQCSEPGSFISAPTAQRGSWLIFVGQMGWRGKR